MSKTLQQRLVEALVSKKVATVIEGRSKKYVTLKSNGPGEASYFFVGKAGSLRAGTCYSKSTPILDQTKQRLLRAVQ